MAITREKVLRAVGKYLPRTSNYAVSADLGDRDPDRVFARIQQILLTNLLTDPDAVYYIIFLASQRLLASVQEVIDALELLQSDLQLKALRGDEPVRIDDLSKLSMARTSLVRLSTGVAREGTFGRASLEDFQGYLEDFMGEQVSPSVSANRVRVSSDIRSNMESLQSSWEQVLARREEVFSLLDRYMKEDLRSRVASGIVGAIQSTLDALERTLPALSTEEQSRIAEDMLVDLAAAEAAITIIGDSPSPVGELSAGPSPTGGTSRSYLALEGEGRTEPVLPVVTGEDGSLQMEGPMGGSPFTSLTGEVVGPGPTTSVVEDSSVPDFLAEGVTPRMYLTFVDLGTVHEVTEVTPSQLTISPRTPFRDGLFRYAVTSHAPGRFFHSPGSSFWDEGTATVSDGELARGTGGSWERIVKVSGTDGTNVRAGGSDGVTRPRKASGIISTQVELESTLATGPSDDGFLSFGVTEDDELHVVELPNSAGNPYTIVSIEGERSLTIAGVWGGSGSGPWYIEDPRTAPTTLQTPGGGLLTAGVSAGDAVLLSGPLSGTYPVEEVQSQTSLILTSPPFPYTPAVTWEVIASTEDLLYSEAVNFLISGVLAGDFVEVQGHGVFQVVSVSAHSVRLNAPLSPGPTAVYGLEFEVFSGDSTLRFHQSDGEDFEAMDLASTVPVVEYFAGVQRTVRLPATLEVDGVRYRVRSRSSASVVTVLPLSEGVGAFSGSGNSFEDSTARWLTAGVAASKHELYCVSGPNAGRSFSILSVISETELIISSTADVGAPDYYEIRPRVSSGLTWSVSAGPGSRKITSSGFFQPEDAGKTLVWKPGTSDEVRVGVDTYVSGSEVWLSERVVTSSGGPQPVAILRKVRRGMQLHVGGRQHTIVSVKDRNTLDVDPRLSCSSGKDLDFLIMTSGANLFSSRIFDPEGAALVDPVNGFTGEYRGARVHLTVDGPVKARYVQPYDPGGDGFSEAFQVDAQLRLGYRRVTYQVLLAEDNQSNLFICEGPQVEEGDVLTVWGIPTPFHITGTAGLAPEVEWTISPPTYAGLQDRDYVVHRGGSRHYGRWYLYKSKNEDLQLDESTEGLRLNVAEVLIEFGELNVVLVESGSAGSVSGPRDFEDPSASFTSSGARFGDRLRVTYPGGDLETAWVTSVVSESRIRLDRGIPSGSDLEWELERNSISASLRESERLRVQMAGLRDIIRGYTVERDDAVGGISQLLEDQRLDRALDLLLEGKIDDFLNVTSQSGSYATLARTSLQELGSSTSPAPRLRSQLAGSDPSGGSASISATSATASSSDDGISEEVEVRVALARALADISGDEAVRSLAFSTFEEQRNRAIFELCGEVESGFLSDKDPTLPWIARTGSLRDRINARYQSARDAVQYLIDHPDEFEDIG